jgi:hypothetical protein
MPQVITPAPTPLQERAAKDWFRAQKFRQLMTQLEQMCEDDDSAVIQHHVANALHELRAIFNELVPEAQHIGVKRVKRRSDQA